MTDSQEVAVRHLDLTPQDTPQSQANSVLAIIAQAVSDPRMDVEKMERLLVMQQSILKQQREAAFMAAMARIAPLLPQIGKFGVSHHGKYALLEDIDKIIRPIYSAEGFSLSFDSEASSGDTIIVYCKLSHREGHFETKKIPVAIDTSGNKNKAQAVISAVSYGRRALTKMFFNLIEAGDDDDGNGGSEPISEDRVKNIEALISEVKADTAKFLKVMGVQKVSDIRISDYGKAIHLLEQKRARA